jgi:hypothetical protein
MAVGGVATEKVDLVRTISNETVDGAFRIEALVGLRLQ